ncbi:MAG: lamin tail domain-containing protein [Myxococcota bacterium]|nr:lamin tail domain-containing protein [Myxococcota bacterium]
MTNHIVLGLVVLASVSCGSVCPTGETCERTCPNGTEPVCAADNLCVCSGAKRGDRLPTEASCLRPQPGELVITEVLIDGEPTEKEEFVEFVNSAAHPISLDGISLLSERGGRIRKHVLFGSGCLPAGAAIAVYADVHRWIYSLELPTQPVVATQSFGFSNERDFHIILESGQRQTLDSVRGGRGQIQPGISIGRESPELGKPFVLHNSIGNGSDSSPGGCPNGGAYHTGCEQNVVHNCRFPARGDLIVNEVLIDGDPDATEEFVEIHNTTSERINLAGLEILSNRGNELAMRVKFKQGCIEKKGYVALFAEPDRWIWTPSPVYAPEFILKRFGFPNTRDFLFVLQTPAELEIDRFAGSRRLIREGESVRRSFVGLNPRLVRHSHGAKTKTSPGIAP